MVCDTGARPSDGASSYHYSRFQRRLLARVVHYKRPLIWNCLLHLAYKGCRPHHRTCPVLVMTFAIALTRTSPRHATRNNVTLFPFTHHPITTLYARVASSMSDLRKVRSFRWQCPDWTGRKAAHCLHSGGGCCKEGDMLVGIY